MRNAKMANLRVALFLFGLSHCKEPGRTTHQLKHVDNIEHVAEFGDAQHRGPNWYAMTSGESETTKSDSSSEEYSYFSSYSSSESKSLSASSVETTEDQRRSRVYRTCTPCPHDMLKKHTNLGIKWICGGYQRARRTFKSECMMHYRNCQDGTMFIKLSDHRCKNDSYHGRHWFYIYEV